MDPSTRGRIAHTKPIYQRQGQSTLSKALATSSERMTLPPGLSTGICRLRKRRLILLAVDLEEINPNQSGYISLPMTLDNLVPKTRVKSFTSVFNKDTGQYESGGSLHSLGITIMIASCIESGKTPTSAASCIAFKRVGKSIVFSHIQYRLQPVYYQSLGICQKGLKLRALVNFSATTSEVDS